MKAHILFQEMTPELAVEILTYFRDEERDAYKTTLTSLAVQKKLRPVFVQRKPVDQQFAWFHDSLKMKSADEIGEHLLQIWLMRSRTAMLTEFLDKVGIEHDGEGSVNELPDSIDSGKLKKAVDDLLKEFPQPAVWLYLHLFQNQRSAGWPEIRGLLETDQRLAACGIGAEG